MKIQCHNSWSVQTKSGAVSYKICEGPRRSSSQPTRDERIVIFCDPEPELIFLNSVRAQPQSKIFFKCEVQVQMKSKKFEKSSLFTTKMPHFYHLTQSKSGPDPTFWIYLQSGSNPNSTQFAIVRIQSNPSPVQCLSLQPTLFISFWEVLRNNIWESNSNS